MKPREPEDSFASDPALGPAERAAAEWTLRIAQGLSAGEEQALSAWLAADPRHSRLFAQMEETSRLLDGLKFQLARAPAPTPSTTAHAPDPAAEVRPQGKSSWRRVAALATGLAAAATLGFWGWHLARTPAAQYAIAESTQLGEVKRLELPDGSVALLNTNTAVEISYEREVRRVRLLSGEAFFTVAKNPARPFIVQAGRIAVRAVGTAFDVRLRSDALSVLVTEGKVRVSGSTPRVAAAGAVDAPATDPLLEVGHLARVVFDADRAPSPEGLVVSTMEERAIKSALAWQEGRLEFSETPLAEVVAEFNRYNRHKIVIADPALAARRFGGAFASHQVEPFLELLEQSFGVVVEHRPGETVIRQVK